MVIADNIQRIQTAKTNIRTSIINKGVDVPIDVKLDTYSGYIDQIQQGGCDPRGKFLISTVLRTGEVIYVNASDSVYFFGYEMTYADNDIMILCRPRIYDNYSSSGHSTYTVYVDCWSLDGTTLDFKRGSASHGSFWTNGSLHAKSYECYREGNLIHFKLNYDFYRSSTSDTFYVLDCIYDVSTGQYSSDEIEVDSSFSLSNTGNMNLYNASWEGSTTGKSSPILKRTPILS